MSDITFNWEAVMLIVGFVIPVFIGGALLLLPAHPENHHLMLRTVGFALVLALFWVEFLSSNLRGEINAAEKRATDYTLKAEERCRVYVREQVELQLLLERAKRSHNN